MGPVIDAERYDAVVFDLDGVVTDTASVHRAAWRRMLEELLGPGEFSDEDYFRYVDGRPRHDGLTAFLASRGLRLPPERIRELADRKDAYFLEALQHDGVRAFPGTVALLDRLAEAGIAVAVISSSRHCTEVLAAAGLADRFGTVVDGVVAAELGLPGKPDPAVFLLAAHRLGAQPRRTVVVEDALAGVEAGRAGGFGLVIGVDRTGQAVDLTAHGADVVVADLGEVQVRRADKA
ncbi:MAG TPA: beta-phosphoglucomutase family hydrolase [Kribbellaceae bacterium]